MQRKNRYLCLRKDMDVEAVHTASGASLANDHNNIGLNLFDCKPFFPVHERSTELVIPLGTSLCEKSLERLDLDYDWWMTIN